MSIGWVYAPWSPIRTLGVSRPVAGPSLLVRARARAMHSQVEQDRQSDPQPGPAADAIGQLEDDSVDQRGDGQKDDAQQRQHPAAMEGAVDQLRLRPDDEERHTGEQRKKTPHRAYSFLANGPVTSLEFFQAQGRYL